MGEGRPSRVCRPWGMGYGVSTDPDPIPHTPYPTPHTPDPGKVPKILDRKNSSVHAFRKEFWESRWESSDQVGCVDLGVWGMGYDRHRPHPTSRRPVEGRRHSHRRRTRRRSTGHDSGNTASIIYSRWSFRGLVGLRRAVFGHRTAVKGDAQINY